MKDSDFDKIGKQLHDMEADPPREGWEKIGAALRAPGAGTSQPWWKRHGWKPFVVLIPAALYLLYPTLRKQQAAGAIAEATVEQPKTSASSAWDADAKAPRSTTDGKVTPPTGTARQNRQAPNTKTLPQTPATKVLVANDPALLEKENLQPAAAEENAGAPVLVEIPTESKPDSTSNIAIVSTDPQAADSLTQQQKENEPRPRAQWRIHATVMPQYVARTVRPSLTDEILVTSVDKPLWKRQANVAFALGVGRSLAPNWYIDAHVSYTSVRQDIFFSYATGKVDTLVAVLLDDQTVQVNPVYELAYRQIQSRYDYAGIRLATTYYFWNSGRGRFNLMGGISSHYLVSARVQERVNNAWVSLSEDGLNRINYSASVGAGYSRLFGKGWEVHVNPTYTYFMREAKSKSVPYSINQRAMGLMVMLSKSLY